MPTSVIPFLASDAATTANWVAALQAALPEQRIVAFSSLSETEKKAVRIAIVANPEPAQLQQLPQLQWVHSVWAGVERLLQEAGPQAWPLVRLVDPQLAATMAEAVLAWTLYLHRDMPAYARQQRQGRWQARPYRSAGSQTIGLLGLGALGAAAARSLLAAGFQVAGWSRETKQITGVRCFAGAAELPLLLAQANILVCLLPLTATTRDLLDASMLRQLPAGASLINFARGAIVVDQDLRAALDDGHLSHAVLDVFRSEPLPAEAWQWQHPAVTVLPHCSAPTDRASAAAIVASTIRQYHADGSLPATVDRVLGY